jgi:hypothetical protein
MESWQTGVRPRGIHHFRAGTTYRVEMPRPKIYPEERIALNVRIPAALHIELKRIATTRDVSVNFLAIRALSDLVDRFGSAGDPLEDGRR